MATPDTWYTKYISVVSYETSQTSDTDYVFTFSDAMLQTNITKNDMSISIDSSYTLSYSWSAAYKDSTHLLVSVSVSSVLQGTETLNIKLSNYKVFRTAVGGCLNKTDYSAKMKSNLTSSIQSVQSASGFMTYLTYIGILAGAAAITILGGSLEAIWSLINTLQLISYLPFIVPYFPDHVKAMFKIMKMTNMNFDFLSSFFKKLISINSDNIPINNLRLSINEIDSPLFLDNSASILLSFILYLTAPLILFILYPILKWDKFQKLITTLISSFFFNNFLRFFTEGYLEISFGAILNMSQWSFDTPQEIISFILAFIASIFLILFPFISAAQLYDKRKEIKDQNELYLKRYGTMYKHMNEEASWANTMFYPLFMVRRAILVLSIIFLTDYPEAQWNLFILFSFMVRVYLNKI